MEFSKQKRYTKHLPKIFTEEEFEKIIEHILNKKDRPNTQMAEFIRWRDAIAIAIMYYCGLRPAEALELQWKDIDFKEGLIYVRPYINKRKNDLPAIITPPAEQSLKEYKKAISKIGIKTDFLFPSLWTWEPIRTNSFGRKFNHYLKEMKLVDVEYYTKQGLPKYSRDLYSLRHSFGTKVFKKTGSELSTSRMLRHTQVASASVYTHLDTDYKKKIAQEVFA